MLLSRFPISFLNQGARRSVLSDGASSSTVCKCQEQSSCQSPLMTLKQRSTFARSYYQCMWTKLPERTTNKKTETVCEQIDYRQYRPVKRGTYAEKRMCFNQGIWLLLYCMFFMCSSWGLGFLLIFKDWMCLYGWQVWIFPNMFV